MLKKISLWGLPLCLLTILIGGFYYYLYNEKEEIREEEKLVYEEIEEVIKEEVEEEKYIIDIKGAVTKPGVYHITSGSRIMDAINIAGGLTKVADTYYLNLSKKVYDEMVIIIYTKTEINDYKKKLKEDEAVIKKLTEEVKNDAVIDPNVTEEEEPTSLLININQASLEELMTLNGIGEAKAKAIISYREEKGNFTSIEDIKLVSGIGEAIFAKIKNDITI